MSYFVKYICSLKIIVGMYDGIWEREHKCAVTQLSSEPGISDGVSFTTLDESAVQDSTNDVHYCYFLLHQIYINVVLK